MALRVFRGPQTGSVGGGASRGPVRGLFGIFCGDFFIPDFLTISFPSVPSLSRKQHLETNPHSLLGTGNGVGRGGGQAVFHQILYKSGSKKTVKIRSESLEIM